MSFLKFIFVILIVIPVALVMVYIFRNLTSEYNDAIKAERKRDDRDLDRQYISESKDSTSRKNTTKNRKRKDSKATRRQFLEGKEIEPSSRKTKTSSRKTKPSSRNNRTTNLEHGDNQSDIPAYRRNNPNYDAYRRKIDENHKNSTLERASLIDRNNENNSKF